MLVVMVLLFSVVVVVSVVEKVDWQKVRTILRVAIGVGPTKARAIENVTHNMVQDRCIDV